jgi:uncharacterized membrane protein
MTDMVLTFVILGAIVVMCHHPYPPTKFVCWTVAIGAMTAQTVIDHRSVWHLLAWFIVGLIVALLVHTYRTTTRGKESTDEKTL